MAIASGIHLKRLTVAADWLAVAVAVSLPWSTSATSILLVLWLIALIPTLEWNALRGQLTTAAGGLPVLLVLLGALGMLWADVTWHDAFGRLRRLRAAVDDPNADDAIPPARTAGGACSSASLPLASRC